MKKHLKPFLSLLGFSIILSILMILFLSYILLSVGMPSKILTLSVYAIYILSTGISGYLLGRHTRNKRYLWGILLGMAYFITLLVISLIYTGNPPYKNHAFLAFLFSALGGMLGSMCAL